MHHHALLFSRSKVPFILTDEHTTVVDIEHPGYPDADALDNMGPREPLHKHLAHVSHQLWLARGYRFGRHRGRRYLDVSVCLGFRWGFECVSLSLSLPFGCDCAYADAGDSGFVCAVVQPAEGMLCVWTLHLNGYCCRWVPRGVTVADVMDNAHVLMDGCLAFHLGTEHEPQ